jgi:hypothetical protein
VVRVRHLKDVGSVPDPDPYVVRVRRCLVLR